MNKIICILFGHRWVRTSDTQDFCLRCDLRKWHPSRKPVSELDEIIHSDWYIPKKRENAGHPNQDRT